MPPKAKKKTAAKEAVSSPEQPVPIPAPSRLDRAGTPVPGVKGYLRADGVMVSPNKRLKQITNPNGKFRHRKSKERGSRASSRAAASNMRTQLARGEFDEDYSPSEGDEEEDEYEEEMTPEDQDFIHDEGEDVGHSDDSYEPSQSGSEEVDVNVVSDDGGYNIVLPLVLHVYFHISYARNII